jgi:hypothetical protein
MSTANVIDLFWREYSTMKSTEFEKELAALVEFGRQDTAELQKLSSVTELRKDTVDRHRDTLRKAAPDCADRLMLAMALLDTVTALRAETDAIAKFCGEVKERQARMIAAWPEFRRQLDDEYQAAKQALDTGARPGVSQADINRAAFDAIITKRFQR